MRIKTAFQKRFEIIRDSSQNREKRIFAALELLCSPISFLTLLGFLPFMIWAEWTDSLDPALFARLDCLLKVLLAASVGYLTNYIALEMLFKPFLPTRRHPLAFLTLGYWKQGLIPRNKNQIGAEIGKQVEEKLLTPEDISSDLCETVVQLIQKPQTLENARNLLQEMLKKYEPQIASFLIPQIEESLTQSVRQFLTAEKLKDFWNEFLEPQLKSEETRQLIAEKISSGLSSRAPQFMETLRDMVYQYVQSFLQKNPLLSSFGFADSLASGFVSFVNWDDVQEKIKEKLRDPQTIQTLEDELINLGGEFHKWIDSPASDGKIEQFRANLQEKLRLFLKDYLQTQLPLWLERLLAAQELWDWMDREVFPAAQTGITRWIQTDGQALILEKLHLSQRVQAAVEKQDVEEFYQMITHVAAQHLGAIQVLGFFLGSIVGLLQLLI